jgi:NhaD family Na+/H+ antiporter
MTRLYPSIHRWFTLIGLLIAGVLPGQLFAAEGAGHTQDFTSHWAALLALGIFIVAYGFVIAEETLHLRKSKPTMVAAGIIWTIIALVYAAHGDTHTAEIAIRHNLVEFAELFLFLLAAMTYINTMSERGVFDTLRVWLVTRGFSLRKIFWITGILAFFISPVADNLTTALLMATVAMAVGGSNLKFVAVACINIIVAANAGGAFSPFGDITTLMVWQKGLVQVQEFFALFLPSVVNWLVPAIIMSLTVPNTAPEAIKAKVELRQGAWVVVGLFILTITMAVSAHNFLHLPPVLGMMTGLGILKVYGYFLRRDEITGKQPVIEGPEFLDKNNDEEKRKILDQYYKPRRKPFDIFISMKRAEWDTLMFFYGIILCVGGLGTLGYLTLTSQLMYGDLGPTYANILVGILSAIVDNIPVMFAVLAMQPAMDHGQWLLVTLTAGVGGSLLSIGSAAGVAVMGQARGIYTFFAHLKWTWAIALGYAASIWVHFLINGRHFTGV